MSHKRLHVTVSLALHKSGQWQNLALDSADDGRQLVAKGDSASQAQIAISNNNAVITYDQCRAAYEQVHRDWDPMAYERRDGAICIMPTWMDAIQFWQMGPHPLGMALHGGQQAAISQLNHTKRLMKLFGMGEIVLQVHVAELEDLDTTKWVRFNPDKKSIRVYPQYDGKIIVLYHQDPSKRGNGSNRFWQPGDEQQESPNYWQPLFSHGDAALVMPVSVKEGKHGRVINQGSRDNESIYFSEGDITFRVLGLKCEPLGTITLSMH